MINGFIHLKFRPGINILRLISFRALLYRDVYIYRHEPLVLDVNNIFQTF